MRRLRLVLSGLVAASLLGGCAGGGSGPFANTSLTPTVNAPGTARDRARHLIHYRPTPAWPPPRTHRITAQMVARGKAGGWQALTAAGPFSNGAGSELLMTDGTVLVQDYCSPNWWALTPDSTGSYLNGTWTEKAAMPSNYGPLYFASAVLADDKVIVNGGEYNFCGSAETNLGAIYDPSANSWTAVTGPSGWSEIGDAQSVVLPNGTYMIGNCCSSDQAQLNESKMTWTTGFSGKNDTDSEEGWTLLRSGNLVVADVFGEPNSELFNSTSSTWSLGNTLPQDLSQAYEIGPQSMRPDDTVFVAGADLYTAIYSEKTAAWKQGPNFPTLNGQQLDIADGPSTVLPNGNVLMAASPGVYSTPAQFLIFNGKKITEIANPATVVNDSSYNIRTLLLPNGQVLEDDGSNSLYIYTQKVKPYPGSTPKISSVSSSTLTVGKTYKVSGTRFNGLTQANFYGDDDQQATNYPLVRLVTSSGTVVYCRTHGHSTMGIGSSSAASTNFDVPSGTPTGSAKLYVVVNGVASKPASVTISS